MIKLRTIFLTIAVIAITITANAKQFGTFARYSQVTDKEVLVVSSKGIKVLFTAYDNQTIGFTWHDKKQSVSLILPSNILGYEELKGSIYVEELDELMQITTTSNDGLLIKVDKKNFGFTFVNKGNNTEISIGNEMLTGLVSIAQPMMVVEVLDGETKIHKLPKL